MSCLVLCRDFYLFPRLKRYFCSLTVLGIETSCDDTGVAILRKNDKTKLILGEKLYTQQNMHYRFGGIIPPIAQDYHRQILQRVVNQCMQEARITLNQIDLIAVANRPGLPMSLKVGLRYAKHLCRKFEKPLIPIHHMEAHALVARLEQDIPFPFIGLLISGGHCQLVWIENQNAFHLLGETLDEAPGEMFDKIFRRLKLGTFEEFNELSGGRAIEVAAAQAIGYDLFEFPLPLSRRRDCQFSFAGLRNSAMKLLEDIEKNSNTKPDEVVPIYKEFCRSLLIATTKHICQRLQRGIEFCLKHKLKANHRYLVISGGVAANDFIFEACTELAAAFGFQTFRPSKRLCSDNGVMIAWNGIEHSLCNSSFVYKLEDVNVYGKSTFEKSLVDQVKKADLSCDWMKIETLTRNCKN